MIKKRKKRVFISGKRAELRAFETAAEKLAIRLKYVKAFDIDIFLSSDCTYGDWMAHLSPKKGGDSKITPIDPELLFVPHHGSLAMPVRTYAMEQKFTLQHELDHVLSEAYAALKDFKESRDPHSLLHFKGLMAFYHDLLARSKRKFCKIIGRLKSALRKRHVTDLRALLRALTRMISRNIDDEHLTVMNSALLKELLHYFNLLSNGYQNYKRNHREPGIIFT